MVAEAMILCGTVAASKGIENALPLPYRSQLPAELPSAAELERLADGAVRFAAIKRCLSRGLMGTQPAAHFSLGIPAYTQATSPIRRYSDLLVQRQFAAMQTPDGGETPLVTEPREAILRDVESAIREDSPSPVKISGTGNRCGLRIIPANDGQLIFRWLRP